MVNYNNARIYKIVCNNTGDIYYGSTCSQLSKRLSYHKNDYNKWLKGKKNYTTSFRIIENNNYIIVLVEECPCENKEQLYKRERYYIDNYTCVNKCIPGRTQKEYKAIYREKNKEKINEKGKEKITCDCGSEVRKKDIRRHEKTKKHIAYMESLNN